jgi:hypothetical protein
MWSRAVRCSPADALCCWVASGRHCTESFSEEYYDVPFSQMRYLVTFPLPVTAATSLPGETDFCYRQLLSLHRKKAVTVCRKRQRLTDAINVVSHCRPLLNHFGAIIFTAQRFIYHITYEPVISILWNIVYIFKASHLIYAVNVRLYESAKLAVNSMSDDKSSSGGPKPDSETSSTEDYGYYYYPERQGIKRDGLWNKLTEGRSSARTLKCIRNVHECARKGAQLKSVNGILVLLLRYSSRC